MKKRAFNRQRKRVQRCVEYWVEPLGLQWWQRLEVNYFDSRKQFKKGSGRVAVARVHCDWSRLWAEIDVCLPLVADLDDDELDYVIRHELCHVLVSPMAGENADLEELTVTRLAQALVHRRQIFG